MNIKDEVWLRTVLFHVENQMRENNLEGFKSMVRVLARDSLKALEDTEGEWRLNHNSKELREKFHLLHYYLDYLRRSVEKSRVS